MTAESPATEHAQNRPGDAVFQNRRWGWQNDPSLGVPGRKRYAMLIDLRKCTGCEACVVACKSEFDTPLGVSRIWLTVTEVGTYPNVRRMVLPRMCSQCDNPICTRNCPTQATFKHRDGFVIQRDNQCIGCRTCMVACPYNARHFLPKKRTDPNKPTLVVGKCDFCMHRVTRGGQPACVEACPTRAITFGDINDKKSRIRQLADRHPTTVLRPEMGTLPQVYYVGLPGPAQNPVHNYLRRSAQLRDGFDEFKRNSDPRTFGDLPEGENTTRWIYRNLWDALSEFPHKFGTIIKNYSKVFWRTHFRG